MKLDIHRIGGGGIENLRLKPTELGIDPPGISVLRGDSPVEMAKAFLAALRPSKKLKQYAKVVGSTNEEKIREAGFVLFHNPTSNHANHYRIIHPDGIAGFNEANLTVLAAAFVNVEGVV